MYMYVYTYVYLVHVRTRFKKIDVQKVERERECRDANSHGKRRDGTRSRQGETHKEKERERERERGEKQPLEIGSWTGQFCNTRVATSQSIRLEFAPFTVRCNLSIRSLSLSLSPSFRSSLLPRAPYSPIPDQAYAPSSCHSIYQSVLV